MKESVQSDKAVSERESTSLVFFGYLQLREDLSGLIHLSKAEFTQEFEILQRRCVCNSCLCLESMVVMLFLVSTREHSLHAHFIIGPISNDAAQFEALRAPFCLGDTHTQVKIDPQDS